MFKNRKLNSKKTEHGLKISNPKAQKFYITPKIHKPNNPGRPMITSIECHTSEISRVCCSLSQVTNSSK